MRSKVGAGRSVRHCAVGLVCVVAVALGGCSKSPEDAEKALLDTARKMGRTDEFIATRVVELQKEGNMGWSELDRAMTTTDITPETQAAYREWRRAVLKRQSK